jgi:hypothetical protein
MILLFTKGKDFKIAIICIKSLLTNFFIMGNQLINFFSPKTMMEANMNMKEFLNKFLELEQDELV